MTPHTYKDLSEFVQTSPATVFTETRQPNFSLIGLGIVTSPIREVNLYDIIQSLFKPRQKKMQK